MYIYIYIICCRIKALNIVKHKDILISYLRISQRTSYFTKHTARVVTSANLYFE